MIDPKFIGPYKIVKSLGIGGMGAVYLAHHKRHPRKQVAIKVLHPDYADNPEAKKRFITEIESLRALQHPHIVPLLDFNTVGDPVWFAMPYFVRGTLKDALRQGKRFTPSEVSRLLSQVADAIDYTHEQNYLHRDIKPDNILLDEHGNAVLTDFGVAKHDAADNLTNPGYALGTPKYMSRARKTGAPATRKTDVYALGVIIYQLLSHDFQLLQLEETWLYGAIPSTLMDVVSKAVAEREEDTFESAGEFASAFEAALGKQAGGTSSDPVESPAALLLAHSTSNSATPRIARGVVEAFSRSVQPSSPLMPPPRRQRITTSIIMALCSMIVFGMLILILRPEFDFLSIFEDGTRAASNNTGTAVTQTVPQATNTALPPSVTSTVSVTPSIIVVPTTALPSATYYSPTPLSPTFTFTATYTATPVPPTATPIPSATPSPTTALAIPTATALTASPTPLYLRKSFLLVGSNAYDMVSLPATLPCTLISPIQTINCDGKLLWIDVAPVSAAQYQLCVARDMCPRSANQSVAGVATGLNWLNAARFCAWREAGGRLPTDAEISALLGYSGALIDPVHDEWLGVDRQGMLLTDVTSQRAAIWDRTNPFQLSAMQDEVVSSVRNFTFRCVVYK